MNDSDTPGPSIQISPDLQVLMPGRNRIDTAVVSGVRVWIDFRFA